MINSALIVNLFLIQKKKKNKHIKNCIFNPEIKLYPIIEDSIYLDSGF